MKHFTRAAGMAVVGIMLLPAVCMAQEPPFTWEGKGVSTFVGEYGMEELEFAIKIHINEAGEVKGEASSDEGGADIERLYYSAEKDYEWGDFSTRRVIVVMILDKASDSPTLIVMDGRTLSDKFYYGETLIRKYEAGGELAKALEIGDKTAAEIYEDYIPSGIKTARKECVPIGCFKMTGKFVNE